MKEVLKGLLSRASMITLTIPVWVAILVLMITQSSNYYMWSYGVCYVISTMIALRILNNSELNPTHKLAWIVAILLFPIFSGLFYLMLGRSRHDRIICRSVLPEN